MRRRLGLEHARELVVGSPYDFREQALLYVPRTMPDPRSDGFTERAAEEVVVAARALRGARARPHVELPRARRAARRACAAASRTRCSCRARRRASGCSSASATEVDSVLLATSTFWQGVDVPGESLSLLVIDKLPFSAPGDPLHEARCEAVEARGRRLVPRLRAADRGAAAAAGLRPADPRPRRPRRRRDPRPAPAHARATAGRSSARCRAARSSTTAPRSRRSSARAFARRPDASLRRPAPGWRNWSDALGLKPSALRGVGVRSPPPASLRCDARGLRPAVDGLRRGVESAPWSRLRDPRPALEWDTPLFRQARTQLEQALAARRHPRRRRRAAALPRAGGDPDAAGADGRRHRPVVPGLPRAALLGARADEGRHPLRRRASTSASARRSRCG